MKYITVTSNHYKYSLKNMGHMTTKFYCALQINDNKIYALKSKSSEICVTQQQICANKRNTEWTWKLGGTCTDSLKKLHNIHIHVHLLLIKTAKLT